MNQGITFNILISMKFSQLFFIPILILQTVPQHHPTYYGSSPKTSCTDDSNLNPEVNWEKNYCCNGDFESPKLDTGIYSQVNKTIPCWTTVKNFTIVQAKHFEELMGTQAMKFENKQVYQQIFNLTKGKYELKFDYAPVRNSSSDMAAFSVFFNGVQVSNLRPFLPGVNTHILTVQAKSGQNSIEFVDVGGGSSLIDNVGIYSWKTNSFCLKRVYAVLAGYPVNPISTLDFKHNNYKLDSGAPGEYSAWWPIQYRTKGQWIQVSSLTPKLWQSVVIQGTGGHSHRVTKFKVQYTLDGKTWVDYENGKQFSGAIDSNTKVYHSFNPFYATVVRLVALQWVIDIALRFDFIFVESW